MLCPRCAHDTDERAAFCGTCGAPLTLQDEPPLRRLDVALDLDRRSSRTPPPIAVAPPGASVPPGPLLDLPAPTEPQVMAPPPAPASRSHWDLGRALAGAARDDGFSDGPPLPPAAAPHAPVRPASPSPRAPVVPAAAAAARPRPRSAALPGEGVPSTGPRPTAPERQVARAVSGRNEIHFRRPASWRRPAAWAIDAGPLVGGVLYLGSSLLASATVAGAAPVAGVDGLLDLLARESGIVLSLAALLAVSLSVYATLAHALAGATLGKWMLGLRVVGPDGKRPSLARSTARATLAAASGALLGLGFLVALFTRSGRGLHDVLARTWVVEAP